MSKRKLPPDPEGMNDDRAMWAAHALEAFIAQTGQDIEADGPQEIVGDLLCNLMHYCDRMGVKFKDCLRWAKVSYEEETRDEDE